MSNLSKVQYNAIAWFCIDKNLRPELSTFPNYRFTEKETGDVITEHINTLEDWYSAHKKEQARELARQRRMQKKVQR